jgi:hypothetical protein
MSNAANFQILLKCYLFFNIFEGLDHIALFDIVEVLKHNTSLIPVLDLSCIFVERLE